MRDRFGKNNSNYKDGRSLIKHYCKYCGIEVGVYSKQCKSCYRKNSPYKKEPNKCIDCGKPTSKKEYTRCRKCKDIFWRGKNHHDWKNLPTFYCIDCGKVLGNKHNATKRCKSCANSGELNPSWKDGLSKEPYPLGWKNTFKEQIRYRDNYKCQICGVPEVECNRKLCVHHIDYDKTNLSKDNLISLCCNCHPKTNTNRNYWKEYFLNKYIKLAQTSI